MPPLTCASPAMPVRLPVSSTRSPCAMLAPSSSRSNPVAPERSASLAAASADFGSGLVERQLQAEQVEARQTVPSLTVSATRPSSVASNRRRAVAARGKLHAGIGAARQQIDRRIVQRAGDDGIAQPGLHGRAKADRPRHRTRRCPTRSPEPSLAVNCSSRSASVCHARAPWMRRAAPVRHPWPVAPMASCRSPCQPCSSAKRQRHVRAAVRQRQRQLHLYGHGPSHAARRRLRSSAKIAAGMQRRRGEVELVRGEPSRPACEMRHQRQRTVAQPGGQAHAGPASSGRPSVATSRRAPGWRKSKRRGPFARLQVDGRARLQPRIGQSPAGHPRPAPPAVRRACTSSLAGPCHSAGVARHAAGNRSASSVASCVSIAEPAVAQACRHRQASRRPPSGHRAPCPRPGAAGCCRPRSPRPQPAHRSSSRPVSRAGC